MSRRPELRLITHKHHDLPPKWDGQPVEWTPWPTGRTTLALHANDDDLACTECGLIDEKLIALGKRPPPPDATFTADTPRLTKTDGQYTITHEVPAWPVYDLTAHRCRGCGHDIVHDQRTGEWWDLEPADYETDGSTHTDTLW